MIAQELIDTAKAGSKPAAKGDLKFLALPEAEEKFGRLTV
jgi:hypothetical protein